MLLSSLILALLPIPAVLAVARPPPSKCLHSGTERQINEAFAKGGKGATVSLCKGSVHRLNESIAFTAGRQTLTTEGNPTGRERAMIIVEGENLSSAILADCDTCSYATIQSLIVDGNRPQLLRIPKGDALIETGNGEGQTVRDCRLYEPRGWSALHFREGNRKQCRKGLVANNEIGPCGEEWDDEYDGDMTSKPMWGFPNADGVSIACAETVVEGNTIFDTTDGAIVIFGSTGSEIRNNHIFSRTRVILGGINLVDYDPFNGDFMDVKVHHNTLHALSAFFKVGIVIGPSSWSDDTETTVRGASVTDNTLHGQHFGYGIVVSSAKDFAVLRNTIDDDAAFSGVDGPRCPRAPDNGRPQAFLINKGSASGVFQDDFRNGEVQHIICINPPDVDGKAYKPWRLRDSPASIAAREAEHPELAKTAFDSKLADAVVAYQMSLLQAVDGLNHRIDSFDAVSSSSDGHDASAPKEQERQIKTGNAVVDSLGAWLSALEKTELGLHDALDKTIIDVSNMNKRWRYILDTNKPFLVYTYNAVQGVTSKLKPQSKIDSGPAKGQREVAHHHEHEDDEEDEGDGGLLDVLSLLSVGGMLGFIMWNVQRRWRARRAAAKGSKLI